MLEENKNLFAKSGEVQIEREWKVFLTFFFQ